MKEKYKSSLLFIVETAIIVFATLIVAIPFSCKITESGLHILDGDYDFPKLVSFCVEDEKSISLQFSEEVQLVSHSVSSEDDLNLVSTVRQGESNNIVQVELENRTKIGTSYELLGTVKDVYGNSLTFAIPFLGYNDNIPKLIITEIQSESVSSQNKTEKENGTYRNEYVEFLVLESGNLFGLELISAYDGEERKFSFSNIEVSAGEVFMVHLRNRGNGCVSEEESNLSLAFSSYATNAVRDLYTKDIKTSLGNKTDILLLKNSFNSKILDCFVYKESKVTQWKDSFTPYLEELAKNNLINTEEDYYLESDDKTSTKTYSRINCANLLNEFKLNKDSEYPIKMNKNDWVIGKHSPGTM